MTAQRPTAGIVQNQQWGQENWTADFEGIDTVEANHRLRLRPERSQELGHGRRHAVAYHANPVCVQFGPAGKSPHRSEEHTSELQSLMRISYAVFCLKKKNKKCILHITINTST